MIPHGAFDAPRRARAAPLPPELAATERPVVLFFGLLRPYKGLDVLLEAWRGIDDAELWVVGHAAHGRSRRCAPARAAERALRAALRRRRGAAARYFRRADLVVLPYREIDQSGVLFTALAFGKPLLLSATSAASREVAATAPAELVAPGDPAALHDALRRPARRPRPRGALAARRARAPRRHDLLLGRDRPTHAGPLPLGSLRATMPRRDRAAAIASGSRPA